MAKKQNICTTMKNLLNTVGSVRVVANKLLHYNPATTALTDVQIRWLLASPLESIIKNILFFHMIYYAMLKTIKRQYIIQLLIKMEMKEEAARYEEWLEEQEAAYAAYRYVEEQYYELELLAPKPKPEPNHLYDDITLHLDELRISYSEASALLLLLHKEHDQLVQSMLIFHHHHTHLLCSHAAGFGITLKPEHAFTMLPKAIEAYQKASSVTEQIHALQMFNNDGETTNNLVRLQQFLGSQTTQTILKTYQERLKQFELTFSQKSAQMIECKMRCARLETQINKSEASLTQLSQKTLNNTNTFEPNQEFINEFNMAQTQQPELQQTPPQQTAPQPTPPVPTEKSPSKTLLERFSPFKDDLKAEEDAFSIKSIPAG